MTSPSINPFPVAPNSPGSPGSPGPTSPITQNPIIIPMGPTPTPPELEKEFVEADALRDEAAELCLQGNFAEAQKKYHASFQQLSKIESKEKALGLRLMWSAAGAAIAAFHDEHYRDSMQLWSIVAHTFKVLSDDNPLFHLFMGIAMHRLKVPKDGVQPILLKAFRNGGSRIFVDHLKLQVNNHNQLDKNNNNDKHDDKDQDQNDNKTDKKDNNNNNNNESSESKEKSVSSTKGNGSGFVPPPFKDQPILSEWQLVASFAPPPNGFESWDKFINESGKEVMGIRLDSLNDCYDKFILSIIKLKYGTVPPFKPLQMQLTPQQLQMIQAHQAQAQAQAQAQQQQATGQINVNSPANQ